MDRRRYGNSKNHSVLYKISEKFPTTCREKMWWARKIAREINLLRCFIGLTVVIVSSTFFVDCYEGFSARRSEMEIGSWNVVWWIKLNELPSIFDVKSRGEKSEVDGKICIDDFKWNRINLLVSNWTPSQWRKRELRNCIKTRIQSKLNWIVNCDQVASSNSSHQKQTTHTIELIFAQQQDVKKETQVEFFFQLT